MQPLADLSLSELTRLREDPFWNSPPERDLLLHRIHAYPAKFPPFLVPKLIEYLDTSGKRVTTVADTFCGCGTSALESVRLGRDFWGCDINPVATLIARTKSQRCRPSHLMQLHESIVRKASKSTAKAPRYYADHDRLNYWFPQEAIDILHRILRAIRTEVSPGKYRDFFLTGFSNTLKPTSRWLTKSIKPQLDPSKVPADPIPTFDNQVRMMIRAMEEARESVEFRPNVKIVNRNLLTLKVAHSIADAVITSPPYVTSYEYADLHQLSTIWLGYASDYRELRKGSIGSTYHSSEVERIYESVSPTARATFDRLRRLDKGKASSVLRYFSDMGSAIEKIRLIVKNGGSVALVIGDTSYKGVRIPNALALADALLGCGFRNLRVSKRRISFKTLTPYRDVLGRFTTRVRSRRVYSHEYVLVCEK